MDDFRSEVIRLAMGGTLPSVRFFEPTLKFLDWMERTYRRAVIYDVGAGCGHVTKALSKRGLTVNALDINNRDEQESYIQIADGECYDYARGSVVMLCRPCHGEFTERTIRQATKRGAAAILYVGLGKNVNSDLGGCRNNFKKALTSAGQEGELVLRWIRRKV